MPVIPGLAYYSIIWGISGSISTIASGFFIYAIFQTPEKLTSTRNRLLFGLSATDIIFSACAALHTIPLPADTPNLIFSTAYGNQTTCNIQGFLFIVFSRMNAGYNCSLNLYYLTVVKLNLSNDFIEKKVEPFMHGVPIIYCLILGIIALSRKYINARGYVCLIHTVPDTCALDPNLECERGDEHIFKFNFIAGGVPVYLCFFAIIISMSVIYYSVRQQERSMASRYRMLSRRNFSRGTTSSSDRTSSVLSLRRPVSNSRKIMHQAIGYVAVYLLSWTLVIINETIFIAFGKHNKIMRILNAALFPMQGLFNFIVFMIPKVTRQLRGNSDYSLWQGIMAAMHSKRIDRRIRHLAMGLPDRDHAFVGSRISDVGTNLGLPHNPPQQSVLWKEEAVVAEEGDDNDADVKERNANGKDSTAGLSIPREIVLLREEHDGKEVASSMDEGAISLITTEL